MTEIILSDEQQAAAGKFKTWLDDFYLGEADRPFFVLEGFAGTGKSFSIKTIIEQQGLKAQYMTYTGKAALVLNKYNPGLGAATIHSSIYAYEPVSDTVFRAQYDKIEKEEDPDEKHRLELELEEMKQPRFRLREPEELQFDADIIVLDECSMVDSEMLIDLESFDIPIVALGDPGQLPPVKGTGALFSGYSNARLTKILRQAEGNPIIEMSMQVREGKPLRLEEPSEWMERKAIAVPVGMVSKETQVYMAMSHDIIICWKNKTRARLNAWMRKVVHDIDYKEHIWPQPGERLIITKNDKTKGIFNGMMADVVKVGDTYDNYVEVFVYPETWSELQRAGEPLKLDIMRACFEEYIREDAWDGLRPWDFKNKQQADFGYAVTCHKAQGSQWERVMVYEEDCFKWNKPGTKELRAQWLYTAITRAIDKVTIISGKV